MSGAAARPPAVLLLALWAAQVGAATAYVSDELVLGVYAGQNTQGQRLATLHSGANVETLSVDGEFTQVRLNDGTMGWVKSAYLTTHMPATVRLKQLEEELDRNRATTPALAEAAARSEVEQLKGALKSLQSELDAARAAAAPVAGSAPAGASAPAAQSASTDPAPGGAAHDPVAVSGIPSVQIPVRSGVAVALPPYGWVWAGACLAAALAFGYWLGYATLARRIRHKFGGIKVY